MRTRSTEHQSRSSERAALSVAFGCVRYLASSTRTEYSQISNIRAGCDPQLDESRFFGQQKKVKCVREVVRVRQSVEKEGSKARGLFCVVSLRDRQSFCKSNEQPPPPPPATSSSRKKGERSFDCSQRSHGIKRPWVGLFQSVICLLPSSVSL